MRLITIIMIMLVMIPLNAVGDGSGTLNHRYEQGHYMVLLPMYVEYEYMGIVPEIMPKPYQQIPPEYVVFWRPTSNAGNMGTYYEVTLMPDSYAGRLVDMC